ncbi:ornithine aminotransferase [Plasmodium gaboni]|uniref:Ornithine aminotransferase n=1 Tax=Plasmodium gaboni TaxID=647221 RepID=A0A151LRH5_9APIC|nr:ornithine aminotransferase [Plasmodium gaboni]KYO01785.1 ornithine aminotransferase [Plasmodium gaboni]SOV12213.1 ornithine aminotransferase [Plasmodium gaboni]
MDFVKDLKSSQDYMNNELTYGAHNYDPIPVVLKRGKGVFVYDIEDRRYYDFLSAYSSVNQGHCHPDILNAMINQAKKLTICSRAFFSDSLGVCERYLTTLFGYDKVLMMNTGAEASETAYKLCRKWGYEVKKIPENSAKLIVCNNNFSGRTLGCVSASTDKKCKNNFGPFVPNFLKVPYDDLEALEKELQDPNVCAFIVEPVQGEAGVIVPSDNYFPGVAALCKKYNVLFVADEVQTGLGRTGKLLCTHHYGVKPDVVLLGKALSGGHYPISAILANDDVMLVLKPGEHGSTYGGNPLAAAICVEALKVLINEKLCENADKLGAPFLENLKQLLKDSKVVREVRGKGLLCAIEFKHDLVNVWDVCLKFKENGLITRSVHDKTVRLTPPLCITKEQLDECTEIIVKTVKFFDDNL